MEDKIKVIVVNILGVDENPLPERISVPSFSIEKRIGPFYGGLGFYNTGFSVTQTNLMTRGTYTSKFSYLHLYSFYPIIFGLHSIDS